MITGAGIVEYVHKSTHLHSATPPHIADVAGHEPRITTTEPRATLPTATPNSRPPTTPASSQPPVPHHTVEPVTGHGPAHGRAGARAHLRVEEHVTLPPAKTKVWSRPIYYIDDLIPHAPKHAIALTVDDGPDPDYTPKVLRLLDKYRMQASFCVVGVHAEAYPKLVRDIAKAGHVIVNHSYTHVQPFNRQTEKRIVAEITKTQHVIEKVAKVTPELFRAPGGAWSHFIYRAIASYDLLPLDWDVDPLDWARPGTRQIERAMLKGRPNDIVLCHDGGGNRSETVRALRKVLPDWKHRGYVTIPLVVPKKLLSTTTQTPATPSQSPSPSNTPTSRTTTSATP